MKYQYKFVTYADSQEGYETEDFFETLQSHDVKGRHKELMHKPGIISVMVTEENTGEYVMGSMPY